MRPLLAVLLMSLAGCATVAECSAHGGVAWREVRSAHFIVHTNLRRDEARTAALELERARVALQAAFHHLSEPKRPLEVVLFHDSFQLDELIGQPFVLGRFTLDWRGPLVLAANDAYLAGTYVDTPVLLHELAHYLSARALRRQPRWFGEGLASYLDTIVIDPEAGTAQRGKVDADRLAAVRSGGPLPVEELWAWDDGDGSLGVEAYRYASAWFWVWYLFNTRRSAIERFLTSLEAGEDPKQAWAAAVPTPPAQLRAEADAFMFGRRYGSQQFSLGPVAEALEERALPDAEVHAWLARAASSVGKVERAQREVGLALGLDSANLRVLEERIVAEPRPDVRGQLARELTAAAPARAAGWLLLAASLARGDPEREQALEHALERDPESPWGLAELALTRAEEHRGDEAISLAERAVAAAPDSARVLVAYAAVLAATGQCATALEAQRRALEVLPDGSPPQLREQLREGLERYRQCAER